MDIRILINTGPTGPIYRGKTMNKIVLIEFESGVINWYPHNTSTLEFIADNIFCIVDVKVIERGEQ